MLAYEEPPAPGPVPLPTSASSSSLRSNSRQQQRPTHHRQGSSMGSSSSAERLGNASVNTQATRDRYANLTTPTNDVVVPNKSRLQEEAIEVPYARDSRDMDAAEPLISSQVMSATPGNMRDGHRPDSRSSGHGGPPTSNSHDAISPNATDDGNYMDRMSFTSNLTSTTTTRGGKPGPGGITSPNGWEDHEHKIRAEYELRIAGLERRIQAVEGERDELQREIADQRERRKDYEDEVRGLKERATGHASSLRSIQDQLDMARDAADAAEQKSRQGQEEARQASEELRQAKEEIAQWRERCEGLEDELHRLETERAERSTREVTPAGDNATVTELQGEMRSLVEELQSLSVQNDELMSGRDRDRETHALLEAKVEEYRKMANAARIELRNLKATSTMFVSQPMSNDHLPASPDGNIADVNVSSFQTGIDSLLAAARSSQPSGVLPSMKAVVEAVTSIGDDVKAFEDSPNLDVDVSRLEMLKYESTTRLSALMTAARNHAMASGLSPVSLIDAAAGHLSSNIVEIIKLLKIRRTGSTRDILNKQPSMRIGDMVRRKSGLYGSIPDEAEEDEAALRGSTSSAGDRSVGGYTVPQPASHDVNQRRPSGSGPASTQSPPRGYGLSPSTGSPSRTGVNLAAAPPPSSFEAPEFRIKSFQSSSSTGKRSDSFDLERKTSVASARSDYETPARRIERNDARTDPYGDPFAAPASLVPQGLRLASNSSSGSGAPAQPVPAVTVATSSPEHSRTPLHQSPLQQRAPLASASASSSEPTPASSKSCPPDSSLTPDSAFYQPHPPPQGGPDAEWEELKPYLNAQSSALVNSIQNLLASIRTGGQGPALNEHLSAVIAVSSSIVGVCRASLPPRLRAQGEPLLADLVGNTDRLSEAQQAASRAGGFDKTLRQGIASASFGVAKALKAFMKVGGTSD